MHKLGIIHYETEGLENYLVLETIQLNSSKCIHVVNLDAQDEFKLGRGKDSDVWVSDISVSRVHALLKKTADDELLLTDNSSKFGSLVMITKPMQLSKFNRVSIQAGRSLLNFSTSHDPVSVDLSKPSITPWDFYPDPELTETDEGVPARASIALRPHPSH
jgi:pSer/pThr/pTyr-binding forkhead associated (FHA) protein